MSVTLKHAIAKLLPNWMLPTRGRQALSIFIIVSRSVCFRAPISGRSFDRFRKILMEDTFLNAGWKDLCVSKDELSLDLTLNMGQCFNWRKVEHTNDTCWVGILGSEPLLVKQTLATTEYITLQGQPMHPADDTISTIMRQYFQVDHNLNALYSEWGQGCERMKIVTQCLSGARVVRQDPWECLISFICSSNNNIPRIIQMLEKLRKRYGRYVCSVQAVEASKQQSASVLDLPIPQWAATGLSMDQETQDCYKWVVNYDQPSLSTLSSGPLHSYELYEFPTVTALAEAAEEDLRALGMGYRAKYIINSAKLVRSKCAELLGKDVHHVKKEGSEPSLISVDNGAIWFDYLRSLAAAARCGTVIKTETTRDVNENFVKVKQEFEYPVKAEPESIPPVFAPMSASTTLSEDSARIIQPQLIDTARLQVQAMLLELPGVGRKVADCVALFSLDQTSAVPVDTHVWNIAIRDYAPQLRRAAVKSESNMHTEVKVENGMMHSSSVASAVATPVGKRKATTSKRGRTSSLLSDVTDTTPQSATPLQTPNAHLSLESTQGTPAEVDSIETRSLTPAVYEAVGAEFRRRFGNYAGWAHSVLFAAELGVFKDRLPVTMQTEMKAFAELQRSAKKVRREEKQEAKKSALDLS